MSGYTVFAQHYDRLTKNVNYGRRAEYFDTLLRRHGASQEKGLLLDLACGTGSLSIELAALGYEVIGADRSGDMLSVAMQKAAGLSPPILFLQQSMEQLDLYGTVENAVCALDSLNHLPGEQALAATLTRLAHFVQPGGLFVFDLNTPYKHQHVLADNAYLYDLDGLFCAWQNSYHTSDQRVDISLDFFQQEAGNRYRRYSERFCERIFDHDTIIKLLEQTGFRLLAVYGDDSLEPPQDTTQRAIYVARREI